MKNQRIKHCRCYPDLSSYASSSFGLIVCDTCCDLVAITDLVAVILSDDTHLYRGCKQGAEDETADLKTTSSGRPVFLLLYMLTQFSQATVATSAVKRSEGWSYKYDAAMMAFSPPGRWKPRK